MSEATMVPGAMPDLPVTDRGPEAGIVCTLLPNLMVKAVLPRGADVTEADIAQLREQLGELAGDRRVAVVLRLAGIASVSRAARASYAAISAVTAWALVGESPVDRLLGHFLLGAEFSSAQARYFTSDREALDWLARPDRG